jgi:hypothetical protein
MREAVALKRRPMERGARCVALTLCMLEVGWPRQREPVVGKHGDHGGGRMPLPTVVTPAGAAAGRRQIPSWRRSTELPPRLAWEVVLAEGTGRVAGNALIDCSNCGRSLTRRTEVRRLQCAPRRGRKASRIVFWLHAARVRPKASDLEAARPEMPDFPGRSGGI